MPKKSAQIEFLNPKGLHPNPAFTQMVTLTGATKMIYIGAQFAVDEDGNIIGKGDLRLQTEQILKQIAICLEAAHAKPEHLIHWSIYIAEGQDMRPAIAAGIQWWGARPNPPMNNVMFVSGFFPADFLISIEAIAAVPLDS